jgi:hypothetical protein
MADFSTLMTERSTNKGSKVMFKFQYLVNYEGPACKGRKGPALVDQKPTEKRDLGSLFITKLRHAVLA